MARIEVRRLEFDSVLHFGHLYFELIGDDGNRIAQINAIGTSPQGVPKPLGGPGDEVRIYDNYILAGTENINANSGNTIFSGSQQQVLKALSYIEAFKDYSNSNHEFLPYALGPIDNSTFNSNSGFNTLGNIISLAIPIDQQALQNSKNTGSNPGVTNDILRGESWSPIVDNAGHIIGSHVVGGSNVDRMNNGPGDDILVGLNNNDHFGPDLEKSTGADGKNTIYGGSEINKVAIDPTDGADTYLFDPAGGRQVVQYADHWEVVTPGNASDTDTLYSIENASARSFVPTTPGDFHNLNGSLIFQDANPTRLATLNDLEGGTLTTAVDVTYGAKSFSLGNFGTFIGTNYTDTFKLADVLGRTFDGGNGTDVDTVDYSAVTKTGMTIDMGLGTALYSSEFAGAGPAAGVYDTLQHIENITGTKFDDRITASSGTGSLSGGDGNDVFLINPVAGEVTTINGGNGTDTVNINGPVSDFTKTVSGSVTTYTGEGSTIALSNVEKVNFLKTGFFYTNASTYGNWDYTNPNGTISKFHSEQSVPKSDATGAYASEVADLASGSIAMNWHAVFNAATGIAESTSQGATISDHFTITNTTGTSTTLHTFTLQFTTSVAISVPSGGGVASDISVWQDFHPAHPISLINISPPPQSSGQYEFQYTANGNYVYTQTYQYAGFSTDFGVDFRLIADGQTPDYLASTGQILSTMKIIGLDPQATLVSDSGVFGTSPVSSNPYLLEGTDNGEVLKTASLNDGIYAGGGNDTVSGGAGNNVLDGGTGIDTLDYSGALSTVIASLASGSVTQNGYGGIDTISHFENITGSGFNDTLTGDLNANAINGGAGNDIINGGAGDDVLDGGAGYDTISYDGAAAGVTFSLGVTGAQVTGGAGTDTVSGFECIRGSGFNDVLTGDGNANVIEGGAGNDILNGGLGIDTVSYVHAVTGVTVNLALTAAQATGGAGTDTLSNFENLNGSNYNDTLTGDANANTINGFSGNDVIEGGAGNDTLIGGAGVDTATYVHAASAVTVNLATTTAQNTLGAGTDTLSGFENLTGSAYDDTLTGDGAANTIHGKGGKDTIFGGDGNDVIYGDAGADTLTGGAGNDRFVFDTALSGVDTIKDFSKTDDILDLSQLLPAFDPLTSAITDFVQITTSGANSLIKVDLDGAANGHVWAQVAMLTGITGLTDEQALMASGHLVA